MQIEALPYQDNLLDLFDHFHHLDHAIMLDSGRPESLRGNLDVFSALPIKTLTIQPDGFFLTESAITQRLPDLTAIKDVLNADWQSQTSDLPFTYGWMGHANYELAHILEPTCLGEPKQSATPLFWAGFYNWAIINDHKKQAAYLVYEDAIATETLALIKSLLNKNYAPTLSPFTLVSPFKALTTKEAYEINFAKIKAHISQGDCYQVNYTFPFHATFKGEPYDAYKTLRVASPSPFMGYFNADYQILSISPERFIQATNQAIVTQPIKGTIKRDKSNSESDRKLISLLKNSHKDRAENTMIVDLLRNDLTKQSTPHSINVDKLCDVESFPNVHHLVSTITADLKEDKTIWDLFFSAFPGGSITGAPKIKACQIINNLEDLARGTYCGSLFYASNNGHFDSNITIRTLSCESNRISAQVGGGIVADSTFQGEYNECEAKIGHLLSALE